MRFVILVVAALPIVQNAIIDQNAGPEARKLYDKLTNIARDPKKILFGQESNTVWGAEGGVSPYSVGTPHDGNVKGWLYRADMVEHGIPDSLCDIQRLTGDYPAVNGIGYGEVDHNNKVLNDYIVRRSYERGELIVSAHHQHNPVTNGTAWIATDKGDTLHTVKRILPGGDFHEVYRRRLDSVAARMKGFKTSSGQTIPIVFRPFHELNGGWFWWGFKNKAQNTAQEIKELYRYTVKYLRDTKQVHNVLYAYSPDRFQDKADYLKLYPGDDYVDILGMDFYYHDGAESTDTFVSKVINVVELAEDRHKIPAVTEIGIFNNGIDKMPNFWSDHILEPLKKSTKGTRIAYLHAWANICLHACQKWTPYRGHPGADAFINNFYKDPVMLFAKDAHLYD